MNTATAVAVTAGIFVLTGSGMLALAALLGFALATGGGATPEVFRAWHAPADNTGWIAPLRAHPAPLDRAGDPVRDDIYHFGDFPSLREAKGALRMFTTDVYIWVPGAGWGRQ